VRSLGFYIASQSRSAGKRFIDAVEQSLQLLLSLPEIGTHWQSENPAYVAMRWWPVRDFPNHLIFYRPVAKGIEVIRVLRAARDLDNQFTKE
jgi:toxin ParE1/3/4